MRLKIISCEVLARELYYCAATSPHIIDIHLIRRGLHETPDVLRTEIQRQIDELAQEDPNSQALPPDAICLGYALCGNATAGLVARNLPLVIPRAHDCITLYLGSRARYSEEFSSHPGTYYYAMDYIERADKRGTAVPLGTTNDARRKEVYEEYVQKYGKDNADYLLEVMGGWTAHYNRAAFIDLGIGDASAIEAKAHEEATSKGWTFDKLAGDLILMRKLTRGEWDDDFLVVPPGGELMVTYDHNIIGCKLAATLKQAGT
jgi:hypothetical protein